jgi:hypothetical protein
MTSEEVLASPIISRHQLYLTSCTSATRVTASPPRRSRCRIMPTQPLSRPRLTLPEKSALSASISSPVFPSGACIRICTTAEAGREGFKPYPRIRSTPTYGFPCDAGNNNNHQTEGLATRVQAPFALVAHGVRRRHGFITALSQLYPRR